MVFEPKSWCRIQCCHVANLYILVFTWQDENISCEWMEKHCIWPLHVFAWFWLHIKFFKDFYFVDIMIVILYFHCEEVWMLCKKIYYQWSILFPLKEVGTKFTSTNHMVLHWHFIKHPCFFCFLFFEVWILPFSNFGRIQEEKNHFCKKGWIKKSEWEGIEGRKVQLVWQNLTKGVVKGPKKKNWLC